MVIRRVTLFKVSSSDSVPKIIEEYEKVSSAVKDGNRYILSCQASETYDDKQSKGFNFAARTSFATLEDMKYYNDECIAHQALKQAVIPLVEDHLSVYWEE